MSLTYRQNISAAAKKDILELEKRIEKFNQGEIAEDKFKLYRLTRGVYGQRQTGVQMIRIKLPYGKVTPQQLITIANVSDKYATGNLHLTTRQDIQLHFVKLADSPALWAELEESDVTLREACGNTVRNVTASPDAGVNPNEPFDVTPYAHALTHFFLRNPICQDMGRKMKIAFTADEQDTAMTYFHDIGFIPKIENGIKGFKIVVGGGLGAVAMTAQTAHEFLPAEEIIPFSEALIRVFDRYGERANRNKARLKFLLKNIGLEKLMELVEAERKTLKATDVEFDLSLTETGIPEISAIPEAQIEDWEAFENWKRTNTFEQKQLGYYGIWLRVPLGDIDSNRARKLAALVQEFAGDDIRVTANQGLLLKYVRPDLLPFFFQSLTELNLAKPGFNSTHDITSCPGSDTCNLAVTNSTGLATALENLLAKNFKHLIDESNIKIKISGCMNACGQHMAANIGFHGSSIKHKGLVIPAMQVVIGGGVSPNGEGFMAEKVIKLPTKRIPTALSLLLNAFETNADWGEYFNDFYQRLGKMHFYHLLKPLAELETLDQAEYIDWGKEEKFIPEIGVGECASVMLDVIGTIIDEAQERLEWAEAGLKEAAHADAIYNSYSAFVIGAKALLLSEDVKCNTQIGILESFEEVFGNNARFTFAEGFKAYVLRMQQHEPSAEFAQEYFNQSTEFLRTVRNYRGEQLAAQGEDKVVISDFYKA
ncbi:nitrite/sulfite reductase [uncultured Roseivirga sp.]|uniref:nitrite/sulfite reductase n=1 Tax=uncultured Roseivirga sp. TaxID=543088 RepID=UPI000D7B1D32|nr:nitrite/sulfite reductase [uncultured Roseivirga sp.]PWL27526.1 MAG: nitrite reductase [Roseivirga sp. XM-24bin3]